MHIAVSIDDWVLAKRAGGAECGRGGTSLGAAGEFACLSYLAGFIEFAGTMIGSGFSRSELQDKILGCMPDNISIEQLRLVVMKYLREHPERLHLSFSQLVAEALRGHSHANA